MAVRNVSAAWCSDGGVPLARRFLAAAVLFDGAGWPVLVPAPWRMVFRPPPMRGARGTPASWQPFPHRIVVGVGGRAAGGGRHRESRSAAAAAELEGVRPAGWPFFCGWWERQEKKPRRGASLQNPAIIRLCALVRPVRDVDCPLREKAEREGRGTARLNEKPSGQAPGIVPLHPVARAPATPSQPITFSSSSGVLGVANSLLDGLGPRSRPPSGGGRSGNKHLGVGVITDRCDPPSGDCRRRGRSGDVVMRAPSQST